jgi:hypothetical protein
VTGAEEVADRGQSFLAGQTPVESAISRSILTTGQNTGVNRWSNASRVGRRGRNLAVVGAEAVADEGHRPLVKYWSNANTGQMNLAVVGAEEVADEGHRPDLGRLRLRHRPARLRGGGAGWFEWGECGDRLQVRLLVKYTAWSKTGQILVNYWSVAIASRSARIRIRVRPALGKIREQVQGPSLRGHRLDPRATLASASARPPAGGLARRQLLWRRPVHSSSHPELHLASV